MEGQTFMRVSVWCMNCVRQVLLTVCELLALSGGIQSTESLSGLLASSETPAGIAGRSVISPLG